MTLQLADGPPQLLPAYHRMWHLTAPRPTTGEISPGQRTEKDAEVMRIKENTGGKSKDFIPFQPVGKLRPRKTMTEAELKLYEKRVELSRTMLNRVVPATAEALVYVPAWNMDEGGEVRRVGEKPKDDEQPTRPEDEGPRQLKPPLEVLEMIKTLQSFLNQGRFLKEELDKNYEGQVAIARVKLMRKHWLDWLEGGDEELAAIGRDPARHTPEVTSRAGTTAVTRIPQRSTPPC